jgi:hypothetical protein
MRVSRGSTIPHRSLLPAALAGQNDHVSVAELRRLKGRREQRHLLDQDRRPYFVQDYFIALASRLASVLKRPGSITGTDVVAVALPGVISGRLVVGHCILVAV